MVRSSTYQSSRVRTLWMRDTCHGRATHGESRHEGAILKMAQWQKPTPTGCPHHPSTWLSIRCAPCMLGPRHIPQTNNTDSCKHNNTHQEKKNPQHSTWKHSNNPFKHWPHTPHPPCKNACDPIAHPPAEPPSKKRKPEQPAPDRRPTGKKTPSKRFVEGSRTTQTAHVRQFGAKRNVPCRAVP